MCFLYGHVKGTSKTKETQISFTGLIQCGECECFYTAETKQKHIKSTGEIRSYTCYRCTRRSEIKCSQKKVIREENLELQIEEEIKKRTTLPEFGDLALEIPNQENDEEIKDDEYKENANYSKHNLRY